MSMGEITEQAFIANVSNRQAKISDLNPLTCRMIYAKYVERSILPNIKYILRRRVSPLTHIENEGYIRNACYNAMELAVEKGVDPVPVLWATAFKSAINKMKYVASSNSFNNTSDNNASEEDDDDGIEWGKGNEEHAPIISISDAELFFIQHPKLFGDRLRTRVLEAIASDLNAGEGYDIITALTNDAEKILINQQTTISSVNYEPERGSFYTSSAYELACLRGEALELWKASRYPFMGKAEDDVYQESLDSHRRYTYPDIQARVDEAVRDVEGKNTPTNDVIAIIGTYRSTRTGGHKLEIDPPPLTEIVNTLREKGNIDAVPFWHPDAVLPNKTVVCYNGTIHSPVMRGEDVPKYARHVVTLLENNNIKTIGTCNIHSPERLVLPSPELRQEREEKAIFLKSMIAKAKKAATKNRPEEFTNKPYFFRGTNMADPYRMSAVGDGLIHAAVDYYNAIEYACNRIDEDEQYIDKTRVNGVGFIFAVEKGDNPVICCDYGIEKIGTGEKVAGNFETKIQENINPIRGISLEIENELHYFIPHSDEPQKMSTEWKEFLRLMGPDDASLAGTMLERTRVQKENPKPYNPFKESNEPLEHKDFSDLREFSAAELLAHTVGEDKIITEQGKTICNAQVSMQFWGISHLPDDFSEVEFKGGEYSHRRVDFSLILDNNPLLKLDKLPSTKGKMYAYNTQIEDKIVRAHNFHSYQQDKLAKAQEEMRLKELSEKERADKEREATAKDKQAKKQKHKIGHEVIKQSVKEAEKKINDVKNIISYKIKHKGR